MRFIRQEGRDLQRLQLTQSPVTSTHSLTAPGTEGYAEDATWLIPRYESVSFVDKYRSVFHLIPAAPSAILDIGAGTGVDSAWLTAWGHKVVAIEPVAAFRDAGIELHSSCQIEWINDSLPELVTIAQRKEAFDVVLLSAVWNHLAPNERRLAMSNIVPLLKSAAVLVMSIRHGLAPANRRVFEICADETIELAKSFGLEMTLIARTPSIQPLNCQAGVTWSWLAFKRSYAP